MKPNKQESEKTLRIQLLPGENLESSCAYAKDMANFLGSKVSFEFDGIQMFAEPHPYLIKLIQMYRSSLKKV
jgi:hypothetical protein